MKGVARIAVVAVAGVVAGCLRPDGVAVTDEASLRQAIEAVRAERAAGETAVREIRLKGTIRLTEPLVLTPEDHDLVFVGEDAVLSGGVAVGPWTADGDGVWHAKIPLDADGKPRYFEQLYVNGRRADCARLPNGDAFFRSQGTFEVRGKKPQVEVKGWREDVPDFGLGCFHFSTMPDEVVAALSPLTERELRAVRQIHRCRWDIDRHPVVFFDREGKRVCVPGEASQNYNAFDPWGPGDGDPVHFENVRTAFDAPGEWYYDVEANEVLYRPLPGETVAAVEAVAPRDGFESLVVLKGEPAARRYVERIVFRDVSFEHSDAKPYRGPALMTSFQSGAVTCCATVLADGAREVTLDGCRVRHTGSYAVWFRDGCMSNALLRCELTDLGGGGVKIGIFDTERMECRPKGALPATEFGPRSTAFNRVDDCLVAGGGRVHMAGCGVLVGHASDNEIVHNEIHDLFYTGVSVGWVWGYAGSVAQRNTVAFNLIYDIGQGQLTDMGGVYTLGTSFGTVVSNNVIHTIRSYNYGGWGLYTDEGSEGVVMENNLVYDTRQNGYHHHYGRNNVLRNNILADEVLAEGVLAMSRREDHHSVDFEHNIFVSNHTKMLGCCGNARFAAPENCTWKGNCWFCRAGKGEYVDNGVFFADWQKLGRDTDGVEADPQFVDAAHGDYTLKPTSPALKCGFKPFNWRLAGRRK